MLGQLIKHLLTILEMVSWEILTLRNLLPSMGEFHLNKYSKYTV